MKIAAAFAVAIIVALAHEVDALSWWRVKWADIPTPKSIGVKKWVGGKKQELTICWRYWPRYELIDDFNLYLHRKGRPKMKPQKLLANFTQWSPEEVDKMLKKNPEFFLVPPEVEEQHLQQMAAMQNADNLRSVPVAGVAAAVPAGVVAAHTLHSLEDNDYEDENEEDSADSAHEEDEEQAFDPANIEFDDDFHSVIDRTGSVSSNNEINVDEEYPQNSDHITTDNEVRTDGRHTVHLKKRHNPKWHAYIRQQWAKQVNKNGIPKCWKIDVKLPKKLRQSKKYYLEMKLEKYTGEKLRHYSSSPTIVINTDRAEHPGSMSRSWNATKNNMRSGASAIQNGASKSAVAVKAGMNSMQSGISKGVDSMKQSHQRFRSDLSKKKSDGAPVVVPVPVSGEGARALTEDNEEQQPSSQTDNQEIQEQGQTGTDSIPNDDSTDSAPLKKKPWYHFPKKPKHKSHATVVEEEEEPVSAQQTEKTKSRPKWLTAEAYRRSAKKPTEDVAFEESADPYDWDNFGRKPKTHPQENKGKQFFQREIPSWMKFGPKRKPEPSQRGLDLDEDNNF